MKPLDRTKKYDLSQLNDDQLQAVLDWLKKNDTGWGDKEIKNLKTSFCVLVYSCDEWILKRSDYDTNALELFEEEPNKVNNFFEQCKTHHLGWCNERLGFFWMKKGEEQEFDVKRLVKEHHVMPEMQDNIYQRAVQLMQDSKQHGLKIVVTFEKL